MNQLKKLNAIHKGIMAFVASEVVEKAGELSEGWNKEEHIQHNSDSLRGQINIFQRQLPKTLNAIENEDIDLIKKSLEMYKKFDIQKDKIREELFDPLREYIESLNDWISILEDALEN